MKCEPIFLAVEQILPEWKREEPGNRALVLLSAQGRKFDQATARRWAGLEEVFLICGRYEGVDERVAEHLASEEIAVGDFVLSGGELGAAMIVDVVARLLPGVLGNEDSAVRESFTEEDLLDYPQYTRPAEFRGWPAPEVLLGGNHAEIRKWRHEAALREDGTDEARFAASLTERRSVVVPGSLPPRALPMYFTGRRILSFLSPQQRSPLARWRRIKVLWRGSTAWTTCRSIRCSANRNCWCGRQRGSSWMTACCP